MAREAYKMTQFATKAMLPVSFCNIICRIGKVLSFVKPTHTKLFLSTLLISTDKILDSFLSHSYL